MAEQASKDGMLLLATGATNADVTLKGDTIFRNCFIDPYQGKMAALFAKDKGFTKVAVIYAKDDDYSNGLKDAFIENCEANGIEVAYTGECMTTDTDYSSQAAQAVASGAELLYYPCFLDTVPLLVGAARNAGFTGVGGDITLDENGDAIKSIAVNTFVDGAVKWTETLGSDGAVVSKAD